MARQYVNHGLIALEGEVHRRTRRGRSLIDRRCSAGKNAMEFRNRLIRDQGGMDNLSAARLAVIELAARDAYYLDEQDRRIMKALKELPQANSPKVVATLYGYRSAVANNLANNLQRLGLEKAPATHQDVG